MQLKLKDKRILFELEQDSRQSLGQLAKKVRLKKETLFYRIKSLEKKEIIKKYLLEIDIYKLGYQFYPVLLRLQNTTPAIEEEIYNYLKTSQYTSWLTFCEGAWDINLTALAKNNFELKIFFQGFPCRFLDFPQNMFQGIQIQLVEQWSGPLNFRALSLFALQIVNWWQAFLYK